MQVPRIEELALLPEEQAVQSWFDGRNWRVLRPVLAIAAAVAAILAPTLASGGDAAKAIVVGVDAALLAAFFLLRRRGWLRGNARGVTLAAVLLQFACFAGVASPDARIALALAFFPLFLLFLRLRAAEATLLAAVFAATGAATVLWDAEWPGALAMLAQVIGLTLPPAAALLLSLHLTKRERRAFLARWRELGARERERARMRDELADARKIQLAMLPEAPPALSWIELSGLSLPASEVGGDFFDYLELPGERLAVVVGDVAGHGVAAALVLAAVKSGLHLLAEELDRPVTVLERLDRMVREAVRWRLFVTLLVAVFERREGQVRVASAGHPPALLVAADGTVTALGEPALPLGTRLPARFVERTAPWRPGDLVVLYSDGLSELADAAGDAFGGERIERVLRRARSAGGAAASARAVREGLLDALFHFKGDAPQRDDVTVVVARRAAERPSDLLVTPGLAPPLQSDLSTEGRRTQAEPTPGGPTR